MKLFKIQLLLFAILLSHGLFAQTEAPSWIDYADKRLNEKDFGTGTLPDFSYAGYDFSNSSIPDISGWNVVDVTNHGANPNDNTYDDTGIKSAIAAAENSGQPSVVFFPKGTYRVHSSSTANSSIEIKKSNIILRGEGAGSGGTEIFCDKKGSFNFVFKHASQSITDITAVTQTAKRGSFTVTVASTNNLSVGQIVELTQRTTKNNDANGVLPIPSNSYTNDWSMKNNGIMPLEKHKIAAINGNTVTFVNPIQLNMPQDGSTKLKKINMIHDVGVEDILFTGNWTSINEDFNHHQNDDHDYAWQAVRYEHCYNSWMRNCEFKHWNECLEFQNCMALTIENVDFTGKRGHSSYFVKFSSNLLFQNLRDLAGHQHGASPRRSSSGLVFSNCEMKTGQSIDCHGSYPYANLLENTNGTFDRNGGNTKSYPNSGPYMTFWNFIHDSNYGSKTFDFWDTQNRKLHTYVNPIFVGFRAPGENITLQNAGKNELKNQEVYPVSLFDAQLQLRLYNGYMSASTEKSNALAKYANDGNPNTRWNSDGNGTGQHLMLDFGVARSVDAVTIDEVYGRVQSFKLEYWDGNSWENLSTGSIIGGNKKITFNSILTRKLRLTFNQVESNQSVSIRYFGLDGGVVIENNPPTGFFIEPTENSIVEGYEALYVLFDASDPDDDEVSTVLMIDGLEIRPEVNEPYEWGKVESENQGETLELGVGEHVFGVVITDSKGASDTIFKTITVLEARGPFGDAPIQIPGTLEAELYDKGGEGIAYHDSDSENNGAVNSNFRENDGVDIGNGNGGYVLGWTSTDEWLEYTIDVTTAGDMDFKFIVSSLNGGGKIGIDLDGESILTDLSVPKTDDWNVYSEMTSVAILSTGEHVLRIHIESAGFNLDRIEVTPTTVTSLNETEIENIVPYPNPSGDGLFNFDKEVDWELKSLTGIHLSRGIGKLVDATFCQPGSYFLLVENHVYRVVIN